MTMGQHCQQPIYHSHRGPYYCYTRQGMTRRVLPRLLREGIIRPHERQRLYDLYFCVGLSEHLDGQGYYRNQRRYRLHRLSRLMHYDRKQREFDLVRRSGLFFVVTDEESGRVVGFASPYVFYRDGMIPL